MPVFVTFHASRFTLIPPRRQTPLTPLSSRAGTLLSTMTVTKEHLREMFEFLRWADQQMMAAARQVPEDGYYKDQGISIGSIHKLLVHCMAAQWVWLSRWRGESPTRLESHEDYRT